MAWLLLRHAAAAGARYHAGGKELVGERLCPGRLAMAAALREGELRALQATRGAALQLLLAQRGTEPWEGDGEESSHESSERGGEGTGEADEDGGGFRADEVAADGASMPKAKRQRREDEAAGGHCAEV